MLNILLGYCTFQIDIQDGLSGSRTKDVNSSSSVDDNRDALAVSPQALSIQNVTLQYCYLDLCLQLCGYKAYLWKAFCMGWKFPYTGVSYLGLQEQSW